MTILNRCSRGILVTALSDVQLSALPAPDQLLESMQARWCLQLGQGRELSVCWYDSFDWRLWQAGLILCVEGGRLWRLTRLTDASPVSQFESNHKPGLAEALPPQLSAELGPLLGLRALLPRLVFSGQRQPLAILDKEGKTLVRLELWQGESRIQAPRPAIYVRIQGLKGYEKTEARLWRWLKKQGQAPWMGTGEPLVWLEDHGQRPGDYSAKLDFAFAPNMAAAKAMVEILEFLLWVMRVNIPGASQGLDSEFLHELRVALRRTRSALSQLKVFEPEAIEPFRQGFGWLGQVTGLTRDLDVHLLEFPAYLALLPQQHQEPLEPLKARIRDHQARAQGQLALDLASERCQSLLHDWQAFLQTQATGRHWSDMGMEPVSELASRRIWRTYERVCKDGEAISDQSPAEALHELRKDCKKLRYLLEFFQHLYPPKQMGDLIRCTKAMLDTLGRFQDLEVQATSLHSLSAGLFAEGSAGQEAEALLIEALLKEQAKERTHFASRLKELLGQKAEYKKLFANRKR